MGAFAAPGTEIAFDVFHIITFVCSISPDISSVAATDSLQLLLLVTLAKLGTRVKFCSCREVLEGFAMGGREGGSGEK